MALARSTHPDWEALVGNNRAGLARFLGWAAERESSESLRLSNRGDIGRARRTLAAFAQPWWGVVVYSCFDSEAGALAVAHAFRQPIAASDAEDLLSNMELPPGAVGGHRIQPAHKGAKVALVSACNYATDFEAILRTGNGFHDRYRALRSLRAKQWGRTTCYDLLVRAGQLKVGSATRYAPDRAYLADSTGPRTGFQLLWGIEVTRSNAEQCEWILRRWTQRWQWVADQVGVRWVGAPYGPGDFENALCIYQERGNPGYGAASDPRSPSGAGSMSSVAAGSPKC